MTRTEFDTWREYHFSHFTGLAGWYEKLPDPLTTLKAWCAALSRCSLEDAKRATSQLFGEQDRDLYFSDHPAQVRRLCEGYVRRRTPTPNTTYNPPKCRTPELHRDYAEQLDVWLEKTDDQRHAEASAIWGAFQVDRAVRPSPCSRCDRPHGDGMFLMVLFDAVVAM